MCTELGEEHRAGSLHMVVDGQTELDCMNNRSRAQFVIEPAHCSFVFGRLCAGGVLCQGFPVVGGLIFPMGAVIVRVYVMEVGY